MVRSLVEVELRPSLGVGAVEHRRRHQPHQLGARERRRARRPRPTPRPGRRRRARSGSSTPARARPRASPSARRCGPRTTAATCRARVEVGLRQPDVPGHEDLACADGDRARRRVRPRRADVGGEVAEGPTADVGQRALGPVGEAGHAELGRRSRAGSGRGPRWRRRGVAPGSGTNGTTSTTPMRGCTPRWCSQVERARPRPRATRRGGVLADEGQHGPVVVRIGVDVEQVSARRGGDLVDRIAVGTRADVHDAFQHASSPRHAPQGLPGDSTRYSGAREPRSTGTPHRPAGDPRPLRRRQAAEARPLDGAGPERVQAWHQGQPRQLGRRRDAHRQGLKPRRVRRPPRRVPATRVVSRAPR